MARRSRRNARARFTTQNDNNQRRRIDDSEIHALRAEFEAFRHAVESWRAEMTDGFTRLWQRFEDWVDKSHTPKYGPAIAAMTLVVSIIIGIGTMALTHLQRSMELQLSAFQKQMTLTNDRQTDALAAVHDVHQAADTEQEEDIEQAREAQEDLERRIDDLKVDFTAQVTRLERDMHGIRVLYDAKEDSLIQRMSDRFTGSMWNLAKEQIDAEFQSVRDFDQVLDNRIRQLEHRRDHENE